MATMPISPCGMRAAMLQLICSILDRNHGALGASLVLWLGVSVKAGVWTVDWTMDWTMDWTRSRFCFSSAANSFLQF